MTGSPEAGAPQPSMETPSAETPYYPWALRDKRFLHKVDIAEGRNLPPAIKEALAWKEGLQLGEKGYDLDDPGTITYLLNKFTTAESAMDRPTTTNLDAAIGNKLDTLYLDIVDRAQTPDGKFAFSSEQLENMATVTSLISWVEARHLLDMTFIERMMMCSSEDNAAELAMGVGKGGRQPTTPDKGHWKALFGSRKIEGSIETSPEALFGDKVDLVLRGIMACGVKDVDIPVKTKEKLGSSLPDKTKIPVDIYAVGFKTETFKNWMQYLLTLSKGDMGAVWTAWRLALTWELTSECAYTTETSKPQGRGEIKEHKIGTSPIVNTLFVWVRWFNEKRAIEYGYQSDNKTRDVHYNKNIEHCGNPLSIGELPKDGLCRDFLHETKFELATIDEKTGKNKTKTLWDKWWQDGVSLAGDIVKLANGTFVEDKFPWVLTEKGAVGADPGAEETGSGAYVSWLFKRRRAFKVHKCFRDAGDISLADIAKPDFFAEKVRDWSMLCKVYENTPPNQNVLALYVRDLLVAHHWEPILSRVPAIKAKPEANYRPTVAFRERFEQQEGAGQDSKSIGVYDILRNARECGFLRDTDINWIIDQLGLPKGFGQERQLGFK